MHSNWLHHKLCISMFLLLVVCRALVCTVSIWCVRTAGCPMIPEMRHHHCNLCYELLYILISLILHSEIQLWLIGLFFALSFDVIHVRAVLLSSHKRCPYVRIFVHHITIHESLLEEYHLYHHVDFIDYSLILYIAQSSRCSQTIILQSFSIFHLIIWITVIQQTKIK